MEELTDRRMTLYYIKYYPESTSDPMRLLMF